MARPPTVSLSRLPFLLPPRRKPSIIRHSRQVQILLPSRHASSSAKDRSPRVLEKPAKFNPPSHPQRLRKAQQPTYTYGPSTTPAEATARATKTYPNMFPPQGTFMHWFLTNKTIHLFITLGTLSTLAITVMIAEFVRTTPFKDLLPTKDEWLARPLESAKRTWDVSKMHSEAKSQEAAEKRKKGLEEAKRRKAFRVAHGMEKAEDGLQLGEGELKTLIGDMGEKRSADGVNVEERKRRPIKKWLGIWE